MSMHIEERTIKETVYFCDVCEMRIDLPASRCRCVMCGQHVCAEHRALVTPTGSDYPSVYCYRCWQLGEPFRAEETLELARHDEALEDIDRRYREAAAAALASEK